MNTVVKTYRENGYHEITTSLQFKINRDVDYSELDYVSADDILGNSSIREYLMKALEARIDACTGQLFRNYGNVVSVTEHQILFKLEKANKIHSYNLPSIKTMQEGIQWLQNFSTMLDTRVAPIWMWEQIGKALYWVEKPKSEWIIQKQGKDVLISFGDVISLVWELHNGQMSDRFGC